MTEPARESPFAGGRHDEEAAAAPEEGAGVVVRKWRPAALLLVNGAPVEAALGKALSAAVVRGQAFEALDTTFLWTGPGQWLAVAPDSPPAALRRHLEAALGGTDATVTDLTHARIVIRVGGARAIDVLAKGCPLDLDAMPEHGCANTLLAHHAVTLHRVGGDAFDVYVMRSFGIDCWQWLGKAAAEYSVAPSAG